MAGLLERWQARINLVGSASLADLWRRHMLDSAQLFSHIPPSARRLVDLGSGAGFPGLVLAILWGGDVHLVDSDQRKCAFLREAARVAGARRVTVHAARIEALATGELAAAADVVTARALAPLPRLIDYAVPLLAPGGICLFLKGRRVEEELTQAGKSWTMQVERWASRAGPDGTIVRLRGLGLRDSIVATH